MGRFLATVFGAVLMGCGVLFCFLWDLGWIPGTLLIAAGWLGIILAFEKTKLGKHTR